MRWVNLAVGVMFAGFVGVQFNDPDPVRWIAMYGAAMMVCFLSDRLPGRWVPGAFATMAFAWALTMAPGVLGEAQWSDLFETMKHENHAEEARELMGLILTGSWMCVITATMVPLEPEEDDDEEDLE